MERVYHHFKLWEDYRNGFYDNCSGEQKKEKLNSCVEMFNSETKTTEYMLRVINEWTFSCEQNLSNPSMNKIAYIGQAACCIYDKIPSTITMEAWSLLSDDVKDRANFIAENVLNTWIEKNKNIQLCLNLD